MPTVDELEAATSEPPSRPACPRCERRDQVVPTFADLDNRGGLPWLCDRCDLLFHEHLAYL
jgi:hypothetical protein